MDNYEEIERLKHLRQSSYEQFCYWTLIWLISLLISIFGLISVIIAIITNILIWKILAISMIILGYITTVILSIAVGILKGGSEAFGQEIDHIISNKDL